MASLTRIVNRARTRDRSTTPSTCSSNTNYSTQSSSEVSLESAPSLQQMVRRRSSEELEITQSGSQLAFTTDDLQRSEVGAGVIVNPPGTKNRRRARRGIMSPIATTDGIISSDAIKGKSKDKFALVSSGSTGSQLRARPTVTTILRQQHVLEKAEKKVRDKLDALMVSTNTSAVDVESLSKQEEERAAEEMKAAEAKRLLQAKLAYERAIAASRKVANEKQKLADDMRQKEKEWQSLLEEQKSAEREKRRALAEQLQRATFDSKTAVGNMLRYNKIKANLVKQETEQLQAEARLKEQKENMKKQDRIQQIQAAKLALKRTKETMSNPNQFYRSIAIPEVQIKLRLQKEEEKKRLQETRKKIQAEKQTKSVKLIRAMKKIKSFETMSKKQSEVFTKKTTSTKVLHHTLSGLGNRPTSGPSLTNELSQTTPKIVGKKDNEIQQMLEELKKLRLENHGWASDPANNRGRAGSAGGGISSNITTTRYVAARNTVSAGNSSGSSVYSLSKLMNMRKPSNSITQTNNNNSNSSSGNNRTKT